MSIHIGTSGWAYDHWKEVFYPPDLDHGARLAFYSQHFKTVEVNNTFYNLPEAAVLESWKEQAEERCTFSLKANRYITHMKKLSDCQEPLERMYEAFSVLGDRLAMVLFQLPPMLHRDLQRLEDFLALLPSDVHHAVEFRHASWYTDAALALLQDNGLALCVHDHQDGPSPWEITAKQVYVRRHAPGGDYGTSYLEQALNDLASRVRALDAESHEVYVYFNNDTDGHAVHNSQYLQESLGQ